jgi:tetratricopeptide (TPR) repeat protein
MDAAGLLLGMRALAPAATPWLGGASAGTLAAAAAALTAGWALYRWHRRRAQRGQLGRGHDRLRQLKERLRRRLAEPADAFADPAACGPTLGAAEAVEADLDTVAKELLPEVGWRRGAAKQILRKRLNGHVPDGAANGTEAAGWRQLGALTLLDDAHDALAVYTRAAALAPDDRDLQMLLGVLNLRLGRLDAAEATFRRQLSLGNGNAHGRGEADGLHDANGRDAADGKDKADGKNEADAEHKADGQRKADAQPEAQDKADAQSDNVGARAKADAQAKANGHDRGETVRYRAGIMLGDALLAKGARTEALAAYETARKVVLALAEREPGSPRCQRDLSLTHDRIGEALLGDGQAEPALASFRRSLEICEALGKTDTAGGVLHDQSVTHDRIGEALELKGDLDGALASYRRGLELAETAAKREPERLDWRWDVSVSLDRIGDILSAKDKADDALAAYRRGLEIAGALAAREPTRLDWQRDLAVSCHKIGVLEARCCREAEAREALERGREIIARLAEIARYQAQWRADLSKFDHALRNLGP